MPAGSGKRLLLLSVVLAGLALSVPVHAQVKRNFNNLGFELPNLQTVGCRVYIADDQVPGWRTTHPPGATQNVGACVVPPGFAQTAPLIELWRTPRDNGSGGAVIAPEGVQVAELNADVASRLYQDVCLIGGESVSWRFSHRGRGSATVYDVANFGLSTDASTYSTVVQVSTTNNGSFLPPVVSTGTGNAPVNIPSNATWVNYSGQFNYAGPTGRVYMGFGAVGGTTSGNLLDDIRLEVVPLVEFTASSSSSPEDVGGNLPQVRVSGTLYSPITVLVQIIGGSAVLGTDFTTPSGTNLISIAVPAGNYDGTAGTGSLFTVPITVINDGTAEGNENILFQIQPSPGPVPSYARYSTTVCGAPAQIDWDYTITDDDQGLTLSKNAAVPVQVAANTAQFDVSYTILVNNPSALALTYTLTDTPGFDANVVINSAVYTLNGSPGAALAGSGPWTLATGRSIAAGATDTYVLTVRFTINRGGSVSNDSCQSPSASGSGLHNLAGLLQAAVGGNPAVSMSATACTATPTPVWINLNKSIVRRLQASDQFEIRIVQDASATAVATALTSGTGTTASTGVIARPSGEVLRVNESVRANGTGTPGNASNYRPTIVCSNSGTAFSGLPSGLATNFGTNSGWTEFLPPAGADIDCTITNSPATADLQVTKTNNVSSLVSGAQTTYTIVAVNNGPDAANNAVLRDPAATGLSCTTASCNASGGASCPAQTGAALVTVLQSAGGAIVPLMPSGGSITVSLTCTVTATGF